MTVEGQTQCLSLTSMQLLKEILQISQQSLSKNTSGLYGKMDIAKLYEFELEES